MTKYYVQNDVSSEADGATESDTVEIDLREEGDLLAATLDGEKLLLDLRKVSEPSLYSLIVGDRSYEVFVEESDAVGSILTVLIGGEQFRLRVQDEWVRHLSGIQKRSHAPEGQLSIKAPMPGVVLGLEVAVGDEVQRGQGLVILGAMKMENQIKSPRDGTVESIACDPGQTVEQGRVLVVIA
jgi:acetyl/propionyl-CoA carboxylase alpha subunit